VNAPVPGCPGCEYLQARLREAEAAFAAQLEVFRAQFAALQSEVARLQAQVDELTARLNQNSGNSSKPPSADAPAARANRPKTPPSGRKPGGQKGHRGRTRCDFLPEAVDQTVECVPVQCWGCGTALPAQAAPGDPKPRTHQVAELPPIRLHVTAYRRHGRGCPSCGKLTWAALPAGVPSGHWGPGVQALASLLTGYFRLSRRRTREFLQTLLGHAPCVGTLVALEAATVRALLPAVQAAEAAVAGAAVVNADETGWRKGRERPTLWVAVTPEVTLFRLGRRDKETYRKLLPEGVPRVLGSDRYVVYDGVAVTERQLCWTHLKRNFQALTELGEARAQAVGRWALAEIRKLFHLWHQFQKGLWCREELWWRAASIQRAFRALLGLGATAAHQACRNLCTSLQDRWEALWTFLRREGVDPTNNAAERALRGAVLWRKGSFGHKSDGGGAFVETMLTVCGSLRLQRRAVMEFVQAACRATLIGDAGPKLVPGFR
jgi:transposase